MRPNRAIPLVFTGCAAATSQRPMQLQRVILYQNGIGYFERAGHVGGSAIQLRLARGELDDVLKTLTVIDRLGGGVSTVEVPTTTEKDKTVALGVRMSAGHVHDVRVAYAVPTPTWKAAYRVVLADPSGAAHASLLQGWAMVNNASQEDWNGVQLTLATGAPMSYALDLHTPEYARRPDATGQLVGPTITGVVGSEKTVFADADGDGIPDVDDRCPNEPETYNGFDDNDGCPDRGRVVVTDTAIQVLERVTFPRGAAVPGAAMQPVIEAVATMLRGNPDIRQVEVGGHAASDEDDPWGLSSRRASEVRSALVQRGIAADRLVMVPYGATQPLANDDTPAARDKNRRVEFRIVQRGRLTQGAARPSYDPQAAQASVHASSKPASVAGSVRYVLGEPVTIRRGASTMISILNKPIAAEDAFLYRPDDHAPGSDHHPFRAVRIANDSGYTLEPGPIAIFARGSFVGDSLIQRLGVGETAWVPYALEGSATVTVTRDGGERPVRIVSIHRGVVEVENADVRTTRYTIAAGQEPAAKIYTRHAKVAGYTVTELPPGTIDQGEAYLMPLPLQPGKTSVLTIEEREPRRRSLELQNTGATEIGLYVSGSTLPAGVADRLTAIVVLRKEIGAIDEQRAGARERLSELGSRADDVRQNLRAIDKVRDTEDLRKRLVATLTELNAAEDSTARQLGKYNEALTAARARLQDALRDLAVGP
jgi:outer membrane protein OmpA-like peptidoglycan-associated protein